MIESQNGLVCKMTITREREESVMAMLSNVNATWPVMIRIHKTHFFSHGKFLKGLMLRKNDQSTEMTMVNTHLKNTNSIILKPSLATILKSTPCVVTPKHQPFIPIIALHLLSLLTGAASSTYPNKGSFKEDLCSSAFYFIFY